jgi:hypothetical protein
MIGFDDPSDKKLVLLLKGKNFLRFDEIFGRLEREITKSMDRKKL